MLQTFIGIWIIFFISWQLGENILLTCHRKSPLSSRPLLLSQMVGLCFMTVYAQIYSLFAGVTTAAFIILAVITLLWSALLFRQKRNLWGNHSPIKWYHLLVWFIFSIGICVVTVYPVEHYDTYLYQSQAIRWIEEYGYVKGLSNLNTRYGFNNSSFAFYALTSFKSILGYSAHMGNAAFCLIIGGGSLSHLLQFRKHKYHVADVISLLTLTYIAGFLVYLPSAGTDYSALLCAFAIMQLWAFWKEQDCGDIRCYSWLLIIALFAMTIKFSMIMLLVLLIEPAYVLIKNKQWKTILFFILCGLTVMLPFIIRNYLISGWFLYPFSAIDIFSVPWKVSKDRVDLESYWIYQAGRTNAAGNCVDISFFQWFPIWWSEKKLQIRIAFVLMLIFIVSDIIYSLYILYRKKSDLQRWGVLKLMLTVGSLYWLLSAPAVRFGWCFLYTIPFIFPLTWLQDYSDRGSGKTHTATCMTYIISSVAVLFLIFTAYSFRWTLKSYVKYVVDNPEQLITQTDYEKRPLGDMQKNGVLFHYPIDSDSAGYYGFPSGISIHDIEGIRFLGDSMKAGFSRD